MKIVSPHFGAVAAMLFVALSGSLRAQVNVTTFHNDNARTGQNTHETILTPANVTSNTFGKAFTTTVDGWVFAQPLYLANVTIAGGVHNVLYVATEHDSLYAIDADTGVIYWKVSLIAAGGTTINSINDLNCTDLLPEVGITGTPVIDTATGTIYLVARSKIGSSFYQYLHALSVNTGAEKFGGPMNVQASVAGNATDGTGSTVPFGPKTQNQRAGLLLENGHVVIGWASHCDSIPWHGWVMSYNASTLAQEAVYNTSPNGYGNGVWMSAGGIAADAAGDIYFATGNGSWNGTTDLGDSVVKLGPPSGGTFPVVDYFTPYNQVSLAQNDLDVASGGLTLLPALPNGKQLLVMQAKEGKIFLVDQNNMGKYCVNLTPACTNSDPNIVQEVPNASVGVWGVPAYWNGYVYWGGGNDNTGATDNLSAFTFNANGSGLMSTSATSRSPQSFGFSAPVPSVSANGTTAGIVWGVDDSTFAYTCNAGIDCQTLYAYDATNLANMLYNSNQAGNLRDTPGGAVKYVTPTIANGKVYIGSQYSVSGYGLISALPVLTPAPGTYTSAQTVTITDATPGVTIYYTTDGSAPTTSSAKYTAPLQISTTTTLSAMATSAAYAPRVASGNYFINSSTMTTVSLSAAGNVDAIVSDGTAVPNGGLDGQGNAYSATLLGTTATWNGIGFTLGTPNTPDAISSKTLTLPAGSYNTLSMLASAVNGSQTGQVFTVTYTDGTTSSFTQSISDWGAPQSYAGESIALTESYRLTPSGAADNRPFYIYGYSFALNSAKTVKSLTLPTNRNVIVLAVELQSGAGAVAAATPTFSPAAGNYASAQSVTLSDSTTGAVIYYTTDGTTPTTGSAQYTAPLNVSTTTTIKALAGASGYTPSAVGSATYNIGASPTTPINDPTGFTGTAGFSLLGGAKLSGTALQMTDGGGNEARAVWFTTPVNVQSFTTDFNFQDTSASADGLTFTIQNASAGVSAIGLPGGSLGYQGITPSVAVKFDLYSNSGEGSDSTGFYTNGVSPMVPSVDMTSSGVNLHSGNPMHAHLTYDGATLTLTLTDTVTLASFTTSSAVNIPTIMGGNTAYVGFTAGTGGLTAVQSILNWTYSTGAPATSAATPSFSPAGGTYTSAQTVTLSDSTAGASIFYTIDGSTPTPSSTKYTAPLSVGATTTVKALATASGLSASAVASATYTINIPSAAATPTFSPAGGTYTSTQTVTLSDSTSGASIFYTLDGSTPTPSSTKYTAPLSVSATTTVKALATASGFTTSAVGSATYTINIPSAAATPTFSPAGGTYTSAQTVTLSDSTTGASIFYTLDGSTPTPSSTKYTAPLTVSATTTLKALATATGFTSSAVGSATYTINIPTPAATPSFSPAGGSYTSAQIVTLADSTTGASIFYTLDGSTPTPSSTKYTAPLTVSVTTTVKAVATATGFTTSAVGSATYTINIPGAAATPTFSPAGGTYTSAQTVTLSDSTTGASIFYTLDGSTPTTGSTKYSAPLTVSATTTVKALASASGFTNSAVASAAYTVTTGSSSPTSVSLAGNANVLAIGKNGVAVTNGGIDGQGYAYSGTALGTTATWGGATFTLGTAGALDAVKNTTVTLPAGNFATLALLATGVNGNQTGQVFTVTYTDGTTTRITQSLSDWFSPQSYAGESIALAESYRLTPSGTLDNRTFNVYGYSFVIDSTRTVKSLTLPSNGNLVVLAIELLPAKVNPAGAAFGAAANVEAIGQDGVAVSNGGMDGQGFAYSGTVLGTSASWAGNTFALGTAGTLDAVSSTTITLPAGNFSKLSLLGTGVSGGQGAQVFYVTYTDGTTTSITQSLSDWFTPQSYSGESIALTAAYRLNPDGSQDNRTFYVYGYNFAIDNTRTVKSLTLPSNRNVVVLSVTLVP